MNPLTQLKKYRFRRFSDSSAWAASAAADALQQLTLLDGNR